MGEIRKNMIKRIFAAALALLLVVCLLPTTVQAAGSTTVNVGGVELNSTTPYLVSGAAAGSGTLGTGGCTAYFDSTSATLTLNGATINTAYNRDGDNDSDKMGIYASGDLTIKLIGSNTINGVAAASGASSYGIYLGGKLTIQNGATGGAVGSLTATGYGSSTQVWSVGIYAGSGITISNSTVAAYGNQAVIYSAGMISGGPVSITGSTVSATGGAANNGYGIYNFISSDNITISGSAVTVRDNGSTGIRGAFITAPVLTDYTKGYKWRTSDSGAYTSSTTTAYTYSAAHTYVEIQPLLAAEYAYNTPAAIVQNGVTATVTYSLPSPQKAATSITATVTLTGTATAMGTHTVNLASTKANLTATAQTATVTAGQDLTTTPITKTFTFTVPAKDADDLTLTHTFAPTLPTITSPKANKTVTVAVGSTKTLSVTAQNATSYQWYVNRNDGAGFGTIAGATNASYTTAAVSKADDGYKYYCIATNANGSTTSAIFTLKASIVPATGDNSALWLWTSLAVLSQTGLAAAYLYRNKKKCRA